MEKIFETIDLISDYYLSDEEIEALLACGIINGCGGSGGINIDEILNSIQEFETFNKNKRNSLKKDIKTICYEHDIDYRFKKGFYSSNMVMVYKVYKLLNWAGKFERIGVCLALFFLLNKFGKNYYKS